MLHLRRVRFASVGHRDARLAPLDLVLTGEDGRPAHTVLWLRNGGGKSSILNLLFSVLRPDRREFLGIDESGRDRSLADYVAGTDTAHVILEWGLPREREPSWVTGMVLEWRDRTRSADRDRLKRLWYGFVPTPVDGQMLAPEHVLGLDTLPLTEDGARLSLVRFRERLREEAAADPGRQLVLTEVQAEWRRALEDRRLDPEVFRYQLAMNREEGGASQLFKRRSRTAGSFVDLLLELALPDDQPAQTAAVFHRYADELAARPALEHNRDFLSGALERLHPLVVAVTERERAEQHLAVSERGAAGTAAALRAAAALAGDRQVRRSAEAATALAEVVAEERRADERSAAAREAERRAAVFRLQAAEATLASASERRAAADAGLRAWQLVPPLADERAAAAEVADLTRQLAAAQDAAAPLRLQRDHAGALLAARLAADAAELTAAAEAAAQRARAADAAADAAGERRAALATRRGRAEAETRSARERLAALARARAALERDGAVHEDEPLAAALARAHDEAAAVGAATRAGRERLTLLNARAVALEERRGEVDRRGEAAARRRAQAQTAVDTLRSRGGALLADPRLAEIAETGSVALFAAAASLAQRLSHLAVEAERRLLDEELEAAADRRALAALDADGLLPARSDLLAARDALVDAGLAAVTGWRYLADSVPPAAREAVLARHPELVDGVVLADPASLELARDVLAAAGLRPASAVVVGTSSPLAAAAAPAPAARFLVPPAPALADREAGASERSALAERLEGLDDRAKGLRVARDRDTALAERLRVLLADYPPGERERLESELDAAEAEHAAVAEAAAALRAEREALAEAVDLLERQRGALETRTAAAQRTAIRLAALAEHTEAEDPPRAPALASELAGVIRELDEVADREREQRAEARAEAGSAATRHGAADRLRARGSELRLPPPPETTAGPPSEPAEVLEDAWRLLDERYRGAVTDPMLQERLDRAQRRRGAAAATVERAQVPDRDAAAALLSSPDGRDVASRERAREAVEDAAREALIQVTRAQERAALLRDALPPPAAQPPALPSEPATLAAAESLAGQLAAQADTAAVSARALRLRVAEAEGLAQDAGRDAERLTDLHDRLADALSSGVGSDAQSGAESAAELAGDVLAARTAAERARSDLRASEQRARGARQAAQAATAALRRFVLDARFDAVEGPLRDRLGRDPDTSLAQRAEGYAADMALRLEQCGAQIAGLNSHRDLLVRQVADRVAGAVHLLRQAERASLLPDGFGEWSGQSFLHIRFERPPGEEELFARLAVLLDGMVDRGERPEGLPLVQQAVHVAVGGRGFSVRILKPNAALRSERVPVSDLATFSGGEQLTAAVLLYCTLSQLRARLRGQRGTGGVLVLDNPIGKSSNVTLLDLQRRVADGLGVQLVYTTAVDDRDAIAALPNRIRLRNARVDRRTGNAHVETMETVDEDTEAGRVSAARLWRREPGPPGPPDDQEREDLA